jgi:flagellar basal body-associated protein FliL
MSRRSIIKETEEDLVQEAEVITRWSKKRIFIAIVIVIFIVSGGIYVASLVTQNAVRVLGARTPDKPEIQVPNEKNVQNVIDSAKQNLSNINAKNIVESQPKLKKIIDDLTNLTGSTSSAKSLICDTLCK